MSSAGVWRRWPSTSRPTSSVRAAFDLATSDLDFLVEFDDLPPAEYADAYFSLKENLESLFGWWPLSPKSLENPNFRDRTYAERKLVYAC